MLQYMREIVMIDSQFPLAAAGFFE